MSVYFFRNWPRFTRKGLRFPVLNLTWLYPWKRPEKASQFFDEDLGVYLSTQSVRTNGLTFGGKIKGVTYEEWLELTAPLLEEGTLILYDINLSQKPIGFWKYVPKEIRSEFSKDMVLLRGDNLEQVMDSIDPEFAKCILL